MLLLLISKYTNNPLLQLEQHFDFLLVNVSDIDGNIELYCGVVDGVGKVQFAYFFVTKREIIASIPKVDSNATGGYNAFASD